MESDDILDLEAFHAQAQAPLLAGALLKDILVARREPSDPKIALSYVKDGRVHWHTPEHFTYFLQETPDGGEETGARLAYIELLPPLVDPLVHRVVRGKVIYLWGTHWADGPWCLKVTVRGGIADPIEIEDLRAIRLALDVSLESVDSSPVIPVVSPGAIGAIKGVR